MELTGKLGENTTHYPNCDLMLIKPLVKNEEAVRCLSRQVQDLQFKSKQNDLHSLHQSMDFEALSKPKMSITASIYKKNDYLLCHDDLCSDRKVAFVYYLTENWTEADGGALRFFNHDEVLQPKVGDYKEVFLPTFNSLVLFRVSSTSHHEVQQVFGNKPRLSINGWYHAEDQLPPISKPLFTRAEMLQFYSIPESKCCLNMLHNGALRKVHHEEMREVFFNKGSLFIKEFFTEEAYQQCVGELKSCTAWTMKGPANHRKYEGIDVTQEGNEVKLSADMPVLTALIKYMISPNWLYRLSSITGVSYAVFDEGKLPPACTVEIQCWKEGFYSLLHDNDAIQMLDTQELTLFFSLERANPSEHIFRSFPTSMFSTTNYHEVLGLIKMRRMRRQVRTDLYELKCSNRRNSTQLSQQLQRLTRASNESIKRCVSQKMKRVERYRKQLYEGEKILPNSNCGLLTINPFCGFGMVKYWPYIQITDPSAEPHTRFYSVTFTYVIENS